MQRFKHWLNQTPCSELDNWLGFYLNEPWGYEIQSFHHAQQATLLANGLFKPRQPFKHEDFMPNFSGATKEPLTEKQQVSMWKAIT